MDLYQSDVNLQTVEAFLKDEMDCTKYHILNVYLFGSRLYKNHRNDSDWDFIVIVSGKNFSL